jgi:4-amino-4-deoxy-L-arabinose transferase-like glycosyltransferase
MPSAKNRLANPLTQSTERLAEAQDRIVQPKSGQTGGRTKNHRRRCGVNGVTVRHKLVLVAILLLAFALRIAALDQIPAGLSHDEAYNGVTAIEVLNGKHAIFFEINKGIEPLIIYLEALAFVAFGIGPVQLRLVNVIFGMLTVALVYPLTTRLFDRHVARLAVAGVTLSFWAVFVSRLALRAVLLPPLLLLTLYLFWRALAKATTFQPSHPPSLHSSNPPAFSSFIFFALSGLTAGVTMYTYLSSRFVPLIILTLLVYLALSHRVSLWHGFGLALFLALWATMSWPLVDYFFQHQLSFTHRADQVSTLPYALNGEFGPLLDNSLRTLGMFTFQGDTTGRYNLDGRPVFDPFNGLLFYLGLALAAWQLIRAPARSAPSVLLFSALFFMLLPDLITDDSPHFLRTIGALPFVYIFWAIGLEKIGRGLQAISHWRLITSPRLSAAYALRTTHNAVRPTFYLLLFSLITLHTTTDYFFRWAKDPQARQIYGADIAEIAAYLKRSPSQDMPAISAEYYRDLDPFRLALHFGGSPPFVIWFDGRQTLAFPPLGSGLSPRYLFPTSAPAAEQWTDWLQPVPPESGRDYRLYRLPESWSLDRLESELTPLGVVVNDDLVLRGYRLTGEVVAGGQAQVLLFWQALRTLPPGTDYTFQVQLWDRTGHLWLAADGNGYDPEDWQPGVRALQLVTLRFPGDFPPRTYEMRLQVIDRRSGQALPTANGQTQVGLGEVPGQLAAKPREINPDRLPNAQLEDPQAGVTGLALRGYKLDQHSVRRDQPLTVTLYWLVQQQPESDYRLTFFLVDRTGEARYCWPAIEPLGGEWSTSRWPAGYWFRDQVDLPATGGVPAGVFELWGQWVGESDDLAHGFSLGRLEIEPSP